MVRLALLLVATATGVTLRSAPAVADDAGDALDLARQGETAAAGGDFAGAVALFKRALALDPRPEYQCNVGIAYYKADDQPRAQLFLSLCLARGSHLDQAFLDGVRGVLVAVEGTLRTGGFTPIDIVVAPASAEVAVSAFAADEVVVGSRLLWLPSGAHTLTVSARGYVTESVPITAEGHDPVRVPVTLEAEQVIGPIEEPVEPPPTFVVERRPGWRRAALVASGVTGLFAVATVLQYLRARDAAGDAGELAPGLAYTLAAEEARDQIRLAYVSYGVTAACAAVTAVLWWQSRSRKVEIGVAPAGDGATISISGGF